MLTRLLGALAEQTIDPHDWELVIVDNCSRDPLVDDVLAALPDIVPCATTVLRTAVNRGPAGARNLGWRSARAAIVAFTDDDVVPSPRWLEAGLGAFNDPQTGVVEGPTRAPDWARVNEFGQLTLRHQFEEPTPYFPACNIFYRRSSLEQTAGFDESIGWWGEDTALGWAVLEAGWRRGFHEDASVVHDVEERPLRWWLRAGWCERHLVEVAARHPGFRHAAFWHRHAVRERDALFAAALGSAIVGLFWRPALLGALPYLWRERPSVHTPRFLRHCLQILAIDATRAAGHLVGSVRSGILVV